MWTVDTEHGVTVEMTGWTALSCARRTVAVPISRIKSVRIERRGDLEPEVDSRILGIGTNIGSSRRGRMRVGRFIGRAVIGEQFWAVPAGDAESMPLLVVDCEPTADFSRLVLYVSEPQSALDRLNSSIRER